MIRALRRLRAGGLRIGALTNNWAAEPSGDAAADAEKVHLSVVPAGICCQHGTRHYSRPYWAAASTDAGPKRVLPPQAREHVVFVGMFDAFVESSVTGLQVWSRVHTGVHVPTRGGRDTEQAGGAWRQKPDPAIYRLALAELGLEPEEVVFLDDIGLNLKPAKVMGITTVKVENDTEFAWLDAVAQLERLTGTAAPTSSAAAEVGWLRIRTSWY
jgi:FMN phosphatase YigB (HAD superfamily)